MPPTQVSTWFFSLCMSMLTSSKAVRAVYIAFQIRPFAKRWEDREFYALPPNAFKLIVLGNSMALSHKLGDSMYQGQGSHKSWKASKNGSSLAEDYRFLCERPLLLTSAELNKHRQHNQCLLFRRHYTRATHFISTSVYSGMDLTATQLHPALLGHATVMYGVNITHVLTGLISPNHFI